MKISSIILLFLLAFISTSFVETATTKNVKTPGFPRIVERILSKKIIKDNSRLTDRRVEVERQIMEAERLRDPVKKWFWYAVISFGLSVLLIIAATTLQKAQGTASPDVNDSCLTVLLAMFGVLGIFFSIIAFVVWLVKLKAG